MAVSLYVSILFASESAADISVMLQLLAIAKDNARDVALSVAAS